MRTYIMVNRESSNPLTLSKWVCLETYCLMKYWHRQQNWSCPCVFESKVQSTRKKWYKQRFQKRFGLIWATYSQVQMCFSDVDSKSLFFKYITHVLEVPHQPYCIQIISLFACSQASFVFWFSSISHSEAYNYITHYKNTEQHSGVPKLSLERHSL